MLVTQFILILAVINSINCISPLRTNSQNNPSPKQSKSKGNETQDLFFRHVDIRSSGYILV
jgi:hypothetical protein